MDFLVTILLSFFYMLYFFFYFFSFSFYFIENMNILLDNISLLNFLEFLPFYIHKNLNNSHENTWILLF